MSGRRASLWRRSTFAIACLGSVALVWLAFEFGRRIFDDLVFAFVVATVAALMSGGVLVIVATFLLAAPTARPSGSHRSGGGGVT